MKKLLVLLGSPRKKQNTDTLAEMVIEKLKLKIQDLEVTRVRLRESDISPCIACGMCEVRQGCAIKDDMEALYKQINCHDLIMMATPLYFNNVSAYSKAMIDRCQAYWSSKYVLNDPIMPKEAKKIGIAVSTAGSKYDNQFEGLRMTLDLFFKAVNAVEIYELFINNTDKRQISEPDIMKKVESLIEDVLKSKL